MQGKSERVSRPPKAERASGALNGKSSAERSITRQLSLRYIDRGFEIVMKPGGIDRFDVGKKMKTYR